MKNTIRNQTGFTIVELSIVIACILIIIGMTSGVYFGVTSRAEEVSITKTLTVTLPEALQSYRMDMGTYPPECGTAPSLSILQDKTLVDTDVQKGKWKGPYLPLSSVFDVTTGMLKDDTLKGVTYCYDKVTTSTQIFHFIRMSGVPLSARDEVMPNIKQSKPSNFPALYNTGNSTGTYNYMFSMTYL